MQALVLSKLDYCNSLLLGSNQYIITKLQRVQIMACHMIYNLKWSLTITPHMKDLHWLRIPDCIQDKVAVYMYKCVHKTAPKYLQDLIQVQVELSSDQRTLRLYIAGKLPTTRSNLTQVHQCSFHQWVQEYGMIHHSIWEWVKTLTGSRRTLKHSYFKSHTVANDNMTTDNYHCIPVAHGSPKLCSCGIIIYMLLLYLTLFLCVFVLPMSSCKAS